MESRRLLRLGPGAHIKVGDADVEPIPTRRVARCVVPIIALFTIAIMAAVLIKVGGDVAGVLRVHTSAGVVNGLYDGVADVWMGIPYAQTSKRWGVPLPVQWDGTRDASHPGPVCPQGKAYGVDMTGDAMAESECLIVNIYAPHGAAKAAADGSQGVKARPVLLFLHGGGFVVGGARDGSLNASLVASTANAVVVVAQYRLGALGFLAHPALTAEAGWSGNYGLLDQQAALQWVYKNAQAFGGDPEQVTLWGQGAGGTGALTHVAMADSTDFFDRVVTQSAAWTSMPSRADAEAAGVATAVAAGCGSGATAAVAACLRSKPASVLVAAGAGRAWGPILDGRHIRSQLAQLLADPLYARAALPGGILAGMGANDSTLHLSYDLANASVAVDGDAASALPALAATPATAGPVEAISPSRFAAEVASRFASAKDPAAIAAFYADLYGIPASGGDPSVTAFQALAQAVTDGGLLCPFRRMLGTANASGLPAFLYQLQHPLSFVSGALAASRQQDAALAMGQPCFIDCGHFRGSFLPTEAALSRRLMGSIAAFARGASPSDSSAAPGGEVVRGFARFGDPSAAGGQALVRLDVPVSWPGSVLDPPDACTRLWDGQSWP